MTTQPVVETRDLIKCYGDPNAQGIRALDGVTLGIPRGQFVALIGPSGAGKSTLLHMLGALDRPTRGEVIIDGQLLSRVRDLDRFRSRTIGFVFQMHNLIPTLTALENVEVPMAETGVSGRRKRERARDLLKMVGLEARGNHLPNMMSGGERQRVAIARSLAMQPQLMLFDEITSALDPELVSEVLNIVRDLAKQGMTMLLATHEMGFAKEVASKVCFLYEGKVHEEGPPDQIFGAPKEERTRGFLKRIIEAGRL